MKADSRLEQVRRFYARQMAVASRSSDPRLERIFELVPREAFLPPGPWRIIADGVPVETPDADPIHLYQNVLVSLDRGKSINNGEPFLHAAWIGAVAPQPGETVVHVGAGAGYYTAILAMLVLEGGHVEAFEIDPDLAEAAGRNCEPFENVTVRAADAVNAPLPPTDIIYVNAGVVAPPRRWLEALKPGGRLIFPWRPAERIGVAVLVTRLASGFSVAIPSGAWFIPCVGASDPTTTILAPERGNVRLIRSAVLTSSSEPDETAIAIYPDLWFSSKAP